uniref:type IX secretion system sortase PorU n=1 Tax=Lutibacter oricola TaxID=762486 RepID=UPI001FE12B13|nr:type IX secretion system sortase PorU [Lutibacter oricola]
MEWQDNVQFRLNADTEISTSLVKGHLINENLLPYYYSDWIISNNLRLKNYKIINPVYESFVPTANIRNASSNLGLKPFVELKFVKQRETSTASFIIVPIIKEKNIYKRLISFDLQYTPSLVGVNSKVSKTTTIKNSVLSNGLWYKFAIEKTGVYKINKSFLQSLGIDVNNIDPKQIKIYGNGGAMLPNANNVERPDGLQENSIYIEGEDDGVFNDGDYILFYARGPHTWNTTGNDLSFYKHEYNIYSEESVYFITVGNSEGKRIQNASKIVSNSAQSITSYHDYIFYEKEEVNLLSAGSQWFGEAFNIDNTQTFDIPFENINTSKDITVRVRAVAESALSSSMNVNVGGANVFSLNFNAANGLTEAYANLKSSSFLYNNNIVQVELDYNNNGNPSAKAYLDYIEVLGEKNLIATGSQFMFRNLDVANSTGSENYEYSITNSNNIDFLWNITNPLAPSLVENISSTGNFKFIAEGGVLQEYLVLNSNDYFEPKKLNESRVENQNLHNLVNIDYLVVTQDYLLGQAQRLVDFHTENSGLNAIAVPLHEIYNEFSSGNPDVTAIRDFIKNLYDHSTTNKIKYVCFLGDASYDYKDRIAGNNNVVPVYESFASFNLASSFVTDDYYGMMDENEGLMNAIDKQDVVTGRIPVTDVNQAEKVIDKILGYSNNESFGSWRTNIMLVADDLDSDSEGVLQSNMESIGDDITLNKPLFNLKKVFADAYQQEISAGGAIYPSVNTEISNQVEKGVLLVDYFGHGGVYGWASERILEVSEIQSWNNTNKLPLFVTVTCEFSRFDNPAKTTAGEYVLWNETGGASSLITTTREVYISVGQAFNLELVKPLLEFNNEGFSIAENLMITKNKFTTSQRYFIYYLGDPAMKLAVPKPNISITKMNDVDVTQSLDTIKALSKVKFEGQVLDVSNNLVDDFNGELAITVFDKGNIKTTLDNGNFGIKMDFDVIESTIFKGRATVKDGVFSVEFVAPKDLKIAYGKGKLSFYADNKKIDKSGYSFDVVVGGVNENAPEDNVGPTVQLYMNDLSFVEGGNTNQSPLFIAVLEDENGINTSITAVDHDIVAYLDGDLSNPIILNEYYQTELNDYTEGKVNYQLRDLEPGLHTITLKAWDTYNNLTESTLTFFVVGDGGLELTNVLNYPNPFVNYTEFWFNHNKPNELLEVQVQIFTVSGKLVKTINETVQSEGNLSRSISWNGLDDFGSRIGKGVYIYKLKVKSLNSNTRAEKTEKLVILQ